MCGTICRRLLASLWKDGFLFSRSWTVVSILVVYAASQAPTPCGFSRAATPPDRLTNVNWLPDGSCVLACEQAKLGYLIFSITWGIVSSFMSVAFSCQGETCAARGRRHDRHISAESIGLLSHIFLLAGFSIYNHRAIHVQCDDWSPYALLFVFLINGSAAWALSWALYLSEQQIEDSQLTAAAFV